MSVFRIVEAQPFKVSLDRLQLSEKEGARRDLLIRAKEDGEGIHVVVSRGDCGVSRVLSFDELHDALDRAVAEHDERCGDDGARSGPSTPPYLRSAAGRAAKTTTVSEGKDNSVDV